MYTPIEHVIYIIESSTQKDWWEPVVAGAAVFVALCALIFTILQARAENRSRILQQTPSLMLNTIRAKESDTQPAEFMFGVTNVGVGPAFIEKVTVRYFNSPTSGFTHNDLRNAALKILSKSQDITQESSEQYLSTAILQDGYYLSAGKEHTFEIIRQSGVFDPLLLFLEYEKNFRMEVIYHNILEPKKKLHFIFPTPENH